MTPSRRPFISNLFVAPTVLKLGLYMPVKKQFEFPINSENISDETIDAMARWAIKDFNDSLSKTLNKFTQQWSMNIGDLITGPNGYKGTIVAVTNGDWRQTTD